MKIQAFSCRDGNSADFESLTAALTELSASEKAKFNGRVKARMHGPIGEFRVRVARLSEATRLCGRGAGLAAEINDETV
jgi:hypothetical protein